MLICVKPNLRFVSFKILIEIEDCDILIQQLKKYENQQRKAENMENHLPEVWLGVMLS